MTIIPLNTAPDGTIYASTGISTEEWLQMLTDGTISDDQRNTLLLFYREPHHMGVCGQMAEKSKGSANSYSQPIWQLGRRVRNKLNRFDIKRTASDGTPTGDSAYWCIPMIGKKSKHGFIWQVKPKLCEAIKAYLYRELLNVYKARRKAISLKADNELYKWEIISACAGKADIDQVRIALTHPHNNLINWRQKDGLIKIVNQKEKDFNASLARLYNEDTPLQSRIETFAKGIAELGKDISERTISVLLACHDPEKYPPYKDSTYTPLCKYLGVKHERISGKKYPHFCELLRPLVGIIANDTEIHNLIKTDTQGLTNSDTLIAQDVAYIIFSYKLIPQTPLNNMFDWIPFYTELAQKLTAYKDKPQELASLIYSNFNRESEIKFLHDEDGSDFKEIDPFSVFSIISRNTSNRGSLIEKMKMLFGIKAKAPTSYDGIPVQYPQNASFRCFSKDLSNDGKDIERLWALFVEAQTEEPEIKQLFDDTLKQKGIGIAKLTMGLFYIHPNRYLSLDKNNCDYLEYYGISTKDTANMHYAEYAKLLHEIQDKMDNGKIKEHSFPEFSANAYTHSNTEKISEKDVYFREIAELLRYKKNIIIEGAPGVGKTYNLPQIIVRLCYPELKGLTDEEVWKRFEELKKNKRVEYVTFHQSMDYEDFVEGFRPDKSNENISYEIKPGIFKTICNRARKPISEEKQWGINDDANVWKVSLAGTGDNPVRSECLNNGHIRIGWDEYGEDPSEATEGKNVLNAFYYKMSIGDIVLSCYSSKTIDAIGVVTGDAEWHDEYKRYKRLRKVKWLIKGINEDIYEMNDETTMTLGTVYKLNNISTDKVISILSKYGVGKPEAPTNDNLQPYVLVIDEINRGNVDKIFGELITLIESDKRIGGAYPLAVRLPYSQEMFSVPSNLYIIGTMNTADRSLDALDYAMRRRFGFVKFLPQSLDSQGFDKSLFEKVAKLFIGNYEDYKQDHSLVLTRSDCLADDINPADVWVGQSYFLMNDKGKDYTALRIKYELVPILEEYIRDGIFKDVSKVETVIEELKGCKNEDI